MRATLLLALAALLAGCSAATPAPPAPPVPTITATTTPPVFSKRSITLADGSRCEVTLAGRWQPPPGISYDSLFGAGSAYGNGELWVGGIPEDGVLEVGASFIEPDGSVRMKFGWWRVVRGTLAITGRRLDGPSAPLRADIPDGYGGQGFQATGLYFPVEGCWEVTGEVSGSTITFALLVRKKLSP